MKIVWHGFLVVVSFGLAFLWSLTLVDFTIQALGILIVVYILSSVIRRRKNPQSEVFGTTGDIFILNIVALLLVTITGNLYSPLFFLLYFLGFGITFIFEPFAVFVFAICCILFFLPQAVKNGSIESFLRIGSIILIAPLAFFFGQEYKERDKQDAEMEALKERAEDAGKTIESDVSEVLEKEKKKLSARDIEKLDEAVEEAEDLEQEAE